MYKSKCASCKLDTNAINCLHCDIQKHSLIDVYEHYMYIAQLTKNKSGAYALSFDNLICYIEQLISFFNI
jgi:hypothetical protein